MSFTPHADQALQWLEQTQPDAQALQQMLQKLQRRIDKLAAQDPQLPDYQEAYALLQDVLLSMLPPEQSPKPQASYIDQAHNAVNVDLPQQTHTQWNANSLADSAQDTDTDSPLSATAKRQRFNALKRKLGIRL